jgi:hypothetical protein
VPDGIIGDALALRFRAFLKGAGNGDFEIDWMEKPNLRTDKKRQGPLYRRTNALTACLRLTGSGYFVKYF